MSPANPIVSVIVPFYNQELYLSECLNSLAKQDFTNIEVVLVDDGSSDQSSRIARDYTKKDPRFRYYRIKHQGVAAVFAAIGGRFAERFEVIFSVVGSGAEILDRDALPGSVAARGGQQACKTDRPGECFS